ncbi:MAG: HD-GYP domain-containing protein [Bdellovibrionales bacterium]|nr:HD-GYP domain-containing protein [Bdellovibrionales bacterium]
MASEKIPDWATDAVGAILNSVNLKDPFTFHHCCRVGRASRKLAKVLGMNDFEQSVLEYSGLLHDVGKVVTPESILFKPGRLTDDEMTIMKDHAAHSAKIVEALAKDSVFFRFTLPGIRYHHERFDGNGYPFQLKGERIPYAARVIAVVDTVDAMTNTRPYRQALTMDAVIAELKRCSGTQFDSNIVRAYLDALPQFENQEDPVAGEIIVSRILESAA